MLTPELLKNWPLPENLDNFAPFINHCQNDKNDLVLMRTEETLRTLTPQSRSLWEKFFDSSCASRVFDSILRFTSSDPYQEHQIRSATAGVVFEELAFLYLREKLTKGRILLSPDQTLSLYKLWYSDHTVIEDYGIKSSINGITVPDGLELRQSENSWLITRICEYKAGIQVERTRAQLRRYRHEPDLFSDKLEYRSSGSEQLGLILTQVVEDLPIKPVTFHPKVKTLLVTPIDLVQFWPQSFPVPFTRKSFGTVLNAIWADCLQRTLI